MFNPMGNTNPQDLGNGGEIDGNLSITGDLTVSGGIGLTLSEVIQGTSTIDVTNTEALLVRKDSDGGDVFIVDTSNTQIGIGVTPTTPLHIKVDNTTTDTTNGLLIEQDGTGDAVAQFLLTGTKRYMMGIDNSDSDNFVINTGAGDLSSGNRLVFNSDMDASFPSNVGIGLTTLDTPLDITPRLQVEGLNASTSSISVFRNSNDAHPPYLILGKSKGTAVNADTAVADNDVLGKIAFIGADGTDRHNSGAEIFARINGTPGGNDLPTELVFGTTADAGTEPTERMTITSAGYLGVGVTPTQLFHTESSINGDWISLIKNTHSTNGHGLKIMAGDNADVDSFRVSDVSNNTLLNINGAGLATFNGHIALPDASGSGGVLKLGASEDIQIYHDGSNSYLDHLTGDLKIRSLAHGGDIVFHTEKSDGTQYTSALTIDSNGNSTVGGALTVSGGNVNVDGANRKILIGESGLSGGAFGHIGWNDSSDYLYIGHSYSSAFNTDIVIASGGKIGVGTTTPMNTMQINQSAADGDNGILIVNESTTVSDGDFLGGIGFDSADGNIPSSVLEASCFIGAYSDVNASATDKGGNLVFGCATKNEDDDTTSTEYLRIKSDGRIGQNGLNPADYYADYDNLVIGSTSGATGMTIVSQSNAAGTISFADGTSPTSAQYMGEISYIHSSDKMNFNTGGSARFTLDDNSKMSLSNNDSGGTGGSDSTTGNTLFGMYSGLNIASGGVDNSFYGPASGNGNTTGDFNTAIGNLAGFRNQTGVDNTYVGYGAGWGVSGNSHSDNTAVGFSTLKAITTGGDNVAIGSYAGINMTSGSSNVFIGKSAGNAYNSSNVVAVGAGSLASITSANGNGTTAVGYKALMSMTSASSNTAIGQEAMTVHTTGGKNVAIGHQVMLDTDAGSTSLGSSENVFIGFQVASGTWTDAACNHNVGIGNDVMRGALDGALYNVAVGSEALMSLTTGDGNVTAGYQAGNDITTGEGNICIGRGAGDEFDAENYNIFVGENAGGGAINGADKCIAIGGSALDGAITQDGTISIGHDSLSALTSGANNLAIGFEAAKGITTGTSNIAIGYQAFDSANGAEDNNIAIGVSALGNADHDDLERNIAIGHYAGDGMGAFANLDNIFIGHGAGGGTWTTNNCDSNVSIGNYSMDAAMNDANNNTALGHQALSALTTANGNVCVGFQSGTAITTGIHNICIGYQAGNNITESQGNVLIGTGAAAFHATASSGDDSIVISAGTDAVTSPGTETIRIGVDSDHITCDFGEDASWSHSSDKRIKKDIKDNTLGLEFINDLRTITFKKKAPSEYPKEFDSYNESKTVRKSPDRVNYGFIAQEVKASMDKAGHSEFPVWKENADTMQELGETQLITPLVKAIQELTARVKELENK